MALIPIWCFKNVSEVWSDLLFDHNEKVIIFGQFSCFGLKMASNDLGGWIWPHPISIIGDQETFFVTWHTPKICFLLWLEIINGLKMASNDLGGQIKCAHVTPGWIQGWVCEMKFFIICKGFCVKRAQTNGHTDTFRNYIYRFGISS